MIKVSIASFDSGGCAKALEELGYGPRQVVEFSSEKEMFELAEKLLSKKLNIMIQHCSVDGVVDYLLAVDTKRFQQR